ncbi:uncharacterized protein A1O5_06223 [Cladophialophora psammophila CBS 110553]|uniref:Uncharacterized protein n=1 Tax=Cladophialophora psammophila CBS 110553 TaxID=1182543 RepID=W9WYL2_9EURO|nr:uncharacterized protein A1O5_06223 [Cladophialophora psammophila CBS 110553]EXJ70155.1 hypothetical protein A1O5_06223 [Cladophialophora psammophila CBS 110553]
MESESSKNAMNGFSFESSTAATEPVGVLEERIEVRWLNTEESTQDLRKIDTEKVKRAEEDMRDYKDYVDKLCFRLPRSFERLKKFLERGNCTCTPDCQCFYRATKEDWGSCTCVTTGGNCDCTEIVDTNEKDPRTKKHKTRRTCYCPRRAYCATRIPDQLENPAVQDFVRIYSINPKQESNWDEFLKVDEYRASNPTDFRRLQMRLYTDPHFQSRRSRQKRVSAENELETQDEELFPKDECQIITVSHLSPIITQLLGAKFQISADFFNRHLPGTEAISGRLVSRLPSSVQIDFDEIYESSLRAGEIWPQAKLETQDDYAIEGHNTIRENIEKHFLFPVGWDHFPISRQDFIASTTNVGLKSGYEVLLKDHNDKMKNVFQFNLLHRISIYSEPVGHPRTAIIIFYPTLPVHAPGVAKKAQEKGLPVDEQPCECSLHPNEKAIRFRSIPNAIPTPPDFHAIENDKELKCWEVQRQKQAFASAYDIVLKIQLKNCFNENRKRPKSKQTILKERFGPNGSDTSTNHKSKSTDVDKFIRIFAAPVFRLVSANWARLVVRRSFDLDLLEWRSSNCLRSTTVEEIKSRRVAITRHQRDINASIDILHSLAWGERHRDLEETHQSLPSINLGRPNGFLKENEDPDSWWSIYWDFYELKQSMDALEKRATKIYDSLVGEIQVVSLENSESCSRRAQTLNRVAFLFTLILLPFTAVPAVYQTTKGKDAPADGASFARWICYCILIVFAVMVSFVMLFDLWDMDYLHQHGWIRPIKSRWEHVKEYLVERDAWKGVIQNVNDQRGWHERNWPALSSLPGFRWCRRFEPRLPPGDPVDTLP